MLQHKQETAMVSMVTTADKLPVEELLMESSVQSQELPSNTDPAQVAGVNQDLTTIKVSAEFVEEDLHEPDTNNDNFTLDSVDLTDVYDDDGNTAVDANCSLQELVANGK